MADLNAILEAVKQVYSANLLKELAQTEGAVRGTFMEELIRGDQTYWEKIGLGAFKKKTQVFQKLDLDQIKQTRRTISHETHFINFGVEKDQIERTLFDPTSSYVTEVARAATETFDDVGIVAFDAIAKGGTDGKTDFTFDATPVDPTDGTGGQEIVAAGAGLDIAKINLFWLASMRREWPRGVVPTWLIDPKQLQNLTDLDEFNNRDLTSVIMTEEGFMWSFMWRGIRWRVTNRLPKDAGNERSTFVYYPQAMAFGINEDLSMKVVDKSDDYVEDVIQVTGRIKFAATRFEEKGVFRVKCLEA